MILRLDWSTTKLMWDNDQNDEHDENDENDQGFSASLCKQKMTGTDFITELGVPSI